MSVARALVTGAASGIGHITADTFAKAGWHVCGFDRHGKPDSAAVHEWVVCDLADDAAVDAAIERLASERWSALVISAGVAGVGAIERVLRINFFAARRIIDALAPMVEDGGAIILMSSGAGMKWATRQDVLRPIIQASRAAGLEEAVALCPDAATAYVLSKQLLSFYGAWRCLVAARRGLRTNVISPGGVEAPLIPDFTRSIGSESMDFSLAVTGRHAQPAEIADVVLFLASPGARWINGADIRVDGGLTGALAAGLDDNTAWR